MKLTMFSKVILVLVVVGAVGAVVYMNPGLSQKLAPPAQKPAPTNIPPVVTLPDEPAAPTAGITPSKPPGCAQLPEVRFYHWAWNAQMGMMLATGGKQATAGSLMCKHGINLKLIREDNTDAMAGQLVTFAEAVKKGEANPASGAHFIGIMGDGSAAFLKGLNDRLIKLGPDYVAVVVGSAGYSRGEDKFMGPPAWKKTPAAAKGGLVAGVLRDGDWNIALKWLGDNRIANNPDETTWDPDALNWVNATDYVEAATKYVSGFCTELKNTKTGQKEKHCVDGVVTWTPGDVTVAEQKGGLVSIVSTREYRSQMPHVIIGNKKWMSANRKLVTGMLAAIFEGGDLVRSNEGALLEAATVSAQAYNEKDAAYWAKYFKVQTQNDKTGLAVELGGSSVNNLADNLQLFGLAPGSANLFATTYTVFGELAKSQYPNIVTGFYPADKVLDASYVAELGKAGGAASKADLAVFAKTDQLKQVVSRKAWQIQFASGSAKFTPNTMQELEHLFRDLVVAGGTLVEIHGHTDNKGTADQNQKLSEDRAFAVKKWLEKESPVNFPDGRVRVFAHGMSEPVAQNDNEEGRAANRRVEIVMGTSN